MKAFTNLKTTWFISLLFLLTGLSTVFSQTKEPIIPKLYLSSKGTPAGTENWDIAGNPAINNASTDYWKMLKNCVMITPALNLSLYTDVEIRLRIQSFGTVANNSNQLHVTQSVSDQASTPLHIYTATSAANETLVITSTDRSVKFKFDVPAASATSGVRIFSIEILGIPILVPTLHLSENTINFGEVVKDETTSASFTLRGENISKAVSLSIEGNGFTVSPTSFSTEQLATTQTVSVFFTPLAEQVYEASLKIGGMGSDFDGKDSLIALTGLGISASTPVISTDISEFDYGKVYVGEDSTVNISVSAANLGEDISFSDLNETAFSVSMGDGWNPREGGLLHVRYAPTAIGSHTATCQIKASGKTTELVLHGIAIEPSLSMNTTLEFGELRCSKTKEMLLIVKGENLKEGATASLSGEGFSFDKNSLDKEKMSTQKGDTLRISFSPKMIQAYSGSIKIMNGGKEYIVQLSGNGLEMPDFVEDFENFPNTIGYGGATLTVDGREWTVRGFSSMTENSDRYIGTRSIRLRGNSATDNNMIQMNTDKPNGVSVLSFMMGSYGVHAGGSLSIEYSKDAGATWIASGDTLTVDSWLNEGSQMKKKEVALNISGNIRIRISKIYKSGSTSVNVDEIIMADYVLNPVLRADVPKVELSYNLGDVAVEKTIGLEGSDLKVPVTVEILKGQDKAVFKTPTASLTAEEANKKFSIKLSLDMLSITTVGTYVDTLYVHSTEAKVKLPLQLMVTAKPVLQLNSNITEKRLSVREGNTDSTTLVFKTAKNIGENLNFTFSNLNGKTVFVSEPTSVTAAQAMAGEFSIKVKTLHGLTEGLYIDTLSVKMGEQKIFNLPFFLTVNASTAPSISILSPTENANLTSEDFTAQFQVSNIDLSQEANTMEVFTDPATQSFAPNMVTENKVSVNFTGIASGDYILKAILKVDGASVAQTQTNFKVSLATIADPVFTPAAGIYTSVQQVDITCATEGASIRYTTDGSLPKESSTLYQTPIPVEENMKIKTFISCKDHNPRMDSAAYVINLPVVEALSFTPPAGTYDSVLSVVITTATPNAAIYYTTDGSTPSRTSTLYAQALKVDKSISIKAIAYKDQMSASAVATAQYIINLAEEEISPEGKVVFKEDFAGFPEGKPNASASGTEVIALDDRTETPGWSGTKVYSAGGAVKLGTGSALGSITTPTLDLSRNEGVFYVSFRAMAWSGDAKALHIISGSDTLMVENMPNTIDYTFKNYVRKFENGTASSKISFQAEKASKNRFFLDSVYVYQVVPAATEPTITAPALVELKTVQSIEVSKQIVVKGELLTADVKVSSNHADFWVKQSSLLKEQVMSLDGSSFEIVYIGNKLSDSATIRLSSTGVEKLIKLYLTADSLTELADLKALRSATIGAHYKIKGEVVLTANNSSYRNQKWVQDAEAGILIDDSKSVVSTQYAIGDGISSMIGSLAKFGEQLQFVPLQDFGKASSQANPLTPMLVTVDQLQEGLSKGTYESRLVKLEGVKFLQSGHFESNKDHKAVQGEDTLNIRTFVRDADYIGTEIPTELVDILCIAARYNQDLQVAPRFLKDIEIAGEEEPECKEPTGLEVSNIDTTSAVLSWKAEAAAYEVKVGEQAAQLVSTTTFKAKDLKPNTVYAWKVRSVCENELYSHWVEGSFKTKANTSIEDAQALNIRLYPNPNNGSFTLEIPKPMQMDIYNISGSKLISRKIQGKDLINMQSYGAGLYFVRLISADGSQSVQRIIVK